MVGDPRLFDISAVKTMIRCVVFFFFFRSGLQKAPPPPHTHTPSFELTLKTKSNLSVSELEPLEVKHTSFSCSGRCWRGGHY